MYLLNEEFKVKIGKRMDILCLKMNIYLKIFEADIEKELLYAKRNCYATQRKIDSLETK